jgi:hypothetical protein
MAALARGQDGLGIHDTCGCGGRNEEERRERGEKTTRHRRQNMFAAGPAATVPFPGEVG